MVAGTLNYVEWLRNLLPSVVDLLCTRGQENSVFLSQTCDILILYIKNQPNQTHSHTLQRHPFEMFRPCQRSTWKRPPPLLGGKTSLFTTLQIFQDPSQKHPFCLKGHGNEADFLGFLQKLVPHRLIDPLHYLSSHSAYGFEFAEIFVSKSGSPHGESGVAIRIFLNLASIFRTLNS